MGVLGSAQDVLRESKQGSTRSLAIAYSAGRTTGHGKNLEKRGLGWMSTSILTGYEYALWWTPRNEFGVVSAGKSARVVCCW